MNTSNRKYIGIFLFALVLLLKFPTINTPHHWDTIRIEIKTAVWLLENNFNPLFGEMGWGHPPILFELIALTFGIFGTALWTSHLLVIMFSYLAVYFTFLLGRELFGERTGLAASLLLLFSPLFFAQSGIVQIAVPFTALAVMTVYFLMKGNVPAYLLCGTALVMAKEPGVLIILPAVIYVAMVKKRDILLHAAPLLVFLLWMLSNKLVFGWFLYPESVGYFGVKNFLLHLAHNAYLIFVKDYRWVVTVLAAIRLRGRIDSRTVFLMTVILSYMVFYSFMDVGMLPRYLLVTHPFLFVIGAAGITGLFEDKWRIVLSAILILFILTWTGNRADECGCSLEDNMEYLDLVNTHLAASRFIERNYPDSTVLTTWPQSDELTRPYEGYVDRPVTVRLAYGSPDLSGVGIVYYSPQAHRPDTLENLMSQMNLTLVARFERNGKLAEVYEVL